MVLCFRGHSSLLAQPLANDVERLSWDISVSDALSS
jgi:hypothetical protein